MNWTEGNLNRHSRARKGKETLLRQKEHFAKVRNGLLNASVKISPPSVSFHTLSARLSAPDRRDALKSPPSRKHQSDDRLMSGPYFSESHPKLPAPNHPPEKETQEEAVRQKRRKLLLKGDWVGTNVQKPIEMEFAKPRGSPSNPWGVTKSRRQTSKQKLRRLLGVRHDEGHSKARLSAVKSFSPTSLQRIKVRVGSYERALGESSNVSPRSNSLQAGLSGSGGQPRYHHSKAHREGRGRVCVSRSDASHRSHSSASQAPLLTTSPLLFHPVPTRPALIQLLNTQSADSENADSMFAQVGAERLPVPSSQAEENAVWRTFVAGPEESSASSETGNPGELEHAAQRVVSPGVSQLGTSRKHRDTYEKIAAVPPETPEAGSIDEHKDNTPTATAGMLAKVSPDSTHQRSNETFSDQDQATPIADDYNPSRVRSNLPQPSKSPRSDDRHGVHSTKEQHTTAGSSDEVSLLVLSSSPKLPPSLDVVGEAPSLQWGQSGDSVVGMNTLLPQMIIPQPNGEDSAFQDRPSAAVEKQFPNERTQEDENDMWRNFVFGDSSESLDKALDDARRDTARSLRPSLPSTSTYSYEESQQDFTISPLGRGSIDRRYFSEGLDCLTRGVSTTTSASHAATEGASPADISSESASVSVETITRTDLATRASSDFSSANGNSTSRLLFPNDSAASSVCETGTGTSTINPQQLEKHTETDDCFKFARPKLFVGKKMGHVDEEKRIAVSMHQIRGTNQTHRRQRRTIDGRANIRKLPNYGSDPIEEFEGDCRSDRAEKGSMFGSLETEDGF